MTVSMEAQMEAKLASMGLKSPASPAVREYARQSLSASAGHDSYLSPHSASTAPTAYPISPTAAGESAEELAAAKTLANERAKLKANARISAPASMLSAGGASGGEPVRSALWSERERVVEGRSPSPRTVSGGTSAGRTLERPKSTGSAGEGESRPLLDAMEERLIRRLIAAQPNGSYAGHYLSQSTGPPSSASFLRSPAPYLNPASSTTTTDLENQLSPLVGGNWASMVSTPLIPMFAKSTTNPGGGGMEQGNFGGLSSPGATLDGTSARLGSQWGTEQQGLGGIVLDDVRKFRRSAKIGAGGVEGGALGGMYEARGAGGGQSQLNSMQQNAINLGLVGLSQQQQQQQAQLRETRSGATSPGGSLSAQHAAVAAQQNWRNGLGSPSFLGPQASDLDPFNSLSPANLYHHSPNTASPSAQAQAQANAQANAQLASLFALQQQMLQQQQQMQQLNMAAAAGMALTPVQMLGLQQSQQNGQTLSPGGRMGMGMGMMGMGMGGMGMMG
jgi:hypothetical protein